MGLFGRLFGAGKKHRDRTAGRTEGPSRSDYWQCPRCEAFLKKGLGTLPTNIVGIGTCTNCGAQFEQSEIYGGKFDVFLEFDVSSGKITHVTEEPSPEAHHDEDLLLACREGRLDAVRQLFSQGIPANGIDPNWTPLMMAASNGYYDIVRALLQAGAEVNIVGEFGSAFLLAARSEHLDVVRILLHAGANIDETDYRGTTALMYVAGCGDEDLTKELLQRGADVNRRTGGGSTALYVAAAEGHLPVVKALVEAGAAVDISPASYSGETPLSVSKKNGREDVVEFLSSRL